MNKRPEEALQDIQELLSDCEHILEIDCSDQKLCEMLEQLEILKSQSDGYLEQLMDQKMNSKSGRSREMASLMLTEEKNLQRQLAKGISSDEKSPADDCGDLNIGVLYVEYLTGRAMQSIREALISAMCLKIVSDDM